MIPIFLGGSPSWRDQMISVCKWCQGQSQVPTSQGSLTISTDLLLHRSQSQENLLFLVTFDWNPITTGLSHENCCWQALPLRIPWGSSGWQQLVGEQLLVHRWEVGSRQPKGLATHRTRCMFSYEVNSRTQDKVRMGQFLQSGKNGCLMSFYLAPQVV